VFNFEQPLEPPRCKLLEFGTGQGHGLAVGVRARAWSFIFTSPGWVRALPAFFFPKARFDESLVTPLPLFRLRLPPQYVQRLQQRAFRRSWGTR